MIEFHEGEKIILEKRKHWFLITAEAGMLFLATIAPPISLFFLASYFEEVAVVLEKGIIPFIFLFSLWALVMWISFFIMWTNYYLDVLIITNRRAIDIEQKRFFAREQVSMRLENIQDVKVMVKGFIHSILDLGEVHIQSAGQAREIIIFGMPKPNQIKNAIAKGQEEIAQSKVVNPNIYNSQENVIANK